ncbi:hypothetical protein SAMN02910358_01192 [Lachnospiraceae bacterium XBB1006]|nr:hypothetical protein SAMN02910358_01192 [Lachnospiraceae bacterium XBB1006]
MQFIAFFLAPSLFTQAFSAVKAAAEAIGKGNIISTSDFTIRFRILCGITFLFGRIWHSSNCTLICISGDGNRGTFFCRFLCPMGAIFSLLPELPFTALHRNEKNCLKNCSACRKNCPVRIKLGEDSLQSGECIRCGRCLLTCPKENIKIGRSFTKK